MTKIGNMVTKREHYVRYFYNDHTSAERIEKENPVNVPEKAWGYRFFDRIVYFLDPKLEVAWDDINQSPLYVFATKKMASRVFTRTEIWVKLDPLDDFIIL